MNNIVDTIDRSSLHEQQPLMLSPVINAAETMKDEMPVGYEGV
jgi:hypothetical protein